MLSIAGFPKYENYKDSGHEKIGFIPCSWEVQRLKFLTSINSESLPDNTPRKYLLDYVDIGSVSFEKGIERTEAFIFKDAPSRARRRACSGDVVVSTVRTYLKAIAYVDDQASRYTYSTGFAVVSPGKKLVPDYLGCFVKSNAFTEQVDLVAKGMSYPAINSTELSNLYLACAPADEQKLIAKFLDKKTTKIDEAIAIKERQIALLKERKQIIIQKAVTRGLDPNVPMKDSGVDLIWQIPAHWDFAKMKYYIDILPGYAFKSESYSLNDSDVPLLRGINVSPGYIRWGETVFWPKLKLMGFEQYLLREGDIVIAMDRPWISGGIRVALVTQGDLPSLLLQRVARIRGEDGLLTGYAKLLLSTNLFLYYFGPMLTGISVPHISPEQIENFATPIPPVDEQREILRYIEDESKDIEKAISIQKKQIKSLKEYKATLINSAVTGKVKITPDMVED